MSTTPSVRPLTANDLDALAIDVFGKSVHGLAVEQEGKTLGVVGVLRSYPPQAFSVMDDGLRRYPVTIMRTAKKFSNILDQYPDAFAIANPREANAVNFLKRVGFTHSHTGPDGEVFLWQTQ